MQKQFNGNDIINYQGFQDKIFDYEKDKEWSHKGHIPVLIDFYADWFGSCKMVAPVLEERSKEYEDQLHTYKVDTEVESELASLFEIRSLPTLLFIPVDGDPMMQPGALPKNAFQQVIEGRLLTKQAKS